MDQKIIIISSAIFFVFFVLILLIGFIIRYQKNNYKHLIETEKLQSQFAQTLLQSQLEIQEQTFKHISHELHDNLGQVASLIKINLNTLSFTNIDNATQKIEHTKDITRQLITDIKSLSVSLGADRIAQSGLVKGLETEVDRLNKTDAFEARFIQQGSMPQIDLDKSVILYRMSQEILNNIVKHSGAKHLSIFLEGLENLFIMEFEDDGKGFDVELKKQSGGAGLSNLENRAKLINAKLIITSTPGSGTRIRIELPI